MIRLNQISKSFNVHNGLNRKVLSNLNLSIEEGDCISLLGSNGSGKTTLLRIISGLLRQDKGNIILNDKIDPSEIALLNNNDRSFFSSLTVFENLDFFQGFYSKDSKKRKLEIIENLNNICMSDLINTPYGYLSSGEKKKIAVIRAILRNPKILLLDEYASSLDFESRAFFKNLFKELLSSKKILGILQVTHVLDDINEFSNKVFFLKDGEISKMLGDSNINVIKKIEDDVTK